jgi:putative modified peptide
MAESEGGPLRVEMTPEQAMQLLEALASDDEFRARYASKPADALQEHGIFIGAPLASSPNVVAPDREEIKRLLDEIRRLRDEDPDGILWGFWWLGLGFAALVGFKNLPAGFGPTRPPRP